MTPRLSVCVLILLMVTLISLQHPLTVLNSEESQISSSDLEALQYKGKDGRNCHVIHERQPLENVKEESQNNQHNQCKEKKTEDKNNQDKKRKKRLETEDEVIERNQFYKSVNEETKQDINPDSSKKIKVEEPNPKFLADLKSPVKFNVVNVIRPARQAAGAWGEIISPQRNNEWMFRGGNKGAAEFNEKSNDGGFLQTIKTSFGHRKERECLEVPEIQEVQRFSPDTLETMRKINPLTIGDQVSQMIHDRKCNTKNKLMSKTSFGSGPGPLQNEAQVADLPDDGVLRQGAAYEKQQPSKGVQKQCPSNDYGFSVIILAGDPLNMEGTGARSDSEGKEGKCLKKKQKDCEVDYSDDQSKDINKSNFKNLNRFAEHFPNKELYVPKKIDDNVNFPAYDRDLTFIPDPLNGLVEDAHSVDPVNKEDNRILLGGVQEKPAHMIHVRGLQKKTSNKNVGNNGVGNGNGVNNGVINGNGANNKAKNENVGNNLPKKVNNGNNGAKNINSGNNGINNGKSGDNCATLGISYNCNKNGDKVNNNATIGNDGTNGAEAGNISDNCDNSGENTANETESDTTASSLDIIVCDSYDATPPENGGISTSVNNGVDTPEKMKLTLPPKNIQSDEATPPEIESFGDLIIDLNGTSCQSWGIYYNNTDNINNRNASNNNCNKGNIKTKLFSL